MNNIIEGQKIFTPSSPAIQNFVERETSVNNQITDALRTTGKQIVVYGHSGSGKTTLASIMCGYQRFSSGKIWYCDQLMNNENAESIRKEIGFVN